MPLVIVGVLLLVAKIAEFGPFANWSWWIILAPFAGAVLWWEFADGTGLTQRRAMDKMDKRKADRRDRAMDALGLNKKRERQVTLAKADAARRTTADPTQANSGDSPLAPRPPAPATPPPPEPRREPRL